jgi:hypothetical protein
MKKLQYIYGILTVILVFLGVTFKVQHWPGASVMLVLGITSLIFLFMPAALIDNYRHEGSAKNRILYIVGYITTLVVLGGALFKIMHWPGAGVIILIALPFPFVVFLPVYLYVTSKIENFDLTKTVLVLFLMAHLSAFSALLALNVSKNVLDSNLLVTQTGIVVQNGLTEAVKSDPAIPEGVMASGKDLLAAIEECQRVILLGTGDSPQSFAQDVFSLKYKDAQNMGWKAGGFEEPGSAGEKMLLAMKNFKDELAKSNPSPSLKKLADQLLCTEEASDESPAMYDFTKEANLLNQHLTWVMDYLEGLKQNTMILQMQAVGL